jgi:hypothetical protein
VRSQPPTYLRPAERYALPTPTCLRSCSRRRLAACIRYRFLLTGVSTINATRSTRCIALAEPDRADVRCAGCRSAGRNARGLCLSVSLKPSDRTADLVALGSGYICARSGEPARPPPSPHISVPERARGVGFRTSRVRSDGPSVRRREVPPVVYQPREGLILAFGRGSVVRRSVDGNPRLNRCCWTTTSRVTT